MFCLKHRVSFRKIYLKNMIGTGIQENFLISFFRSKLGLLLSCVADAFIAVPQLSFSFIYLFSPLSSDG